MFFLKQWCLRSVSRKLQPLPVLAASCCVRGVSDPRAEVQRRGPGWERGRAAPCHARAPGFGRGLCKFGVVQTCLRLKVNQNKLTCLYSTWLIRLTLCECSPRVIHLFFSYLWIFPLGWKVPRFSCAWSFPPMPWPSVGGSTLNGRCLQKALSGFLCQVRCRACEVGCPCEGFASRSVPTEELFPSKASPLLM